MIRYLLILLLSTLGCERPPVDDHVPIAEQTAPVSDEPSEEQPSESGPADVGIVAQTTGAADPAPPQEKPNPLCEALYSDGTIRDAIRGELRDDIELEFLVDDGPALRPFFEKSTFTLHGGTTTVELSPQMDDVRMTAVSKADTETLNALAESENPTVEVNYAGPCESETMCDSPEVQWNCRLPAFLITVPPRSVERRPVADVEAEIKAEGRTVARTDKLGKTTLRWWEEPDLHDTIDVGAQMGGVVCSYTEGNQAFIADCPAGTVAVGKKWVVFGECSPHFVQRRHVGAYLAGKRAADWEADARRFPYSWTGEVCRINGFKDADTLQVMSACCGDHHDIELNARDKTRTAKWVHRKRPTRSR